MPKRTGRSKNGNSQEWLWDSLGVAYGGTSDLPRRDAGADSRTSATFQRVVSSLAASEMRDALEALGDGFVEWDEPDRERVERSVAEALSFRERYYGSAAYQPFSSREEFALAHAHWYTLGWQGQVVEFLPSLPDA